MADETLPDIYQALHDLKAAQQELLVITKENRAAGTTTPADARRKVIAQWGNVVDGLLLQLLAHAGSGVRSVLAYGAVADGVTSNTVAIQAAIDAADAAGGGIVVVPLGAAQYSALTLRAGVRMLWITDADPNSALDGADGDWTIRLTGSTPLYVKTGGASDTGWVTALNDAHGDQHAAGGADPLQVSETSRILGRATAGGGDVEELTAAQVASMVASSIDHGATTGKGDDDHPQYVLADGSREMATLTVTGDTACEGDLDVGDGSGSPRINVNKTGTGDAYVQFRQTQGSDTDGDVRVGLDTGEQFTIDRRLSGSFEKQAYISSVLGWVTFIPIHVNGGFNALPGPDGAADLTVGDPNGGSGGITLWLGESGVGRYAFSRTDSVITAYFSCNGETFEWGSTDDAEGLPTMRLDLESLRPASDKGLSAGSSAARFDYAFMGAPSYDVQTGVDDTTISLGDEGYIQINAATGDVTINIPASNAANRGKTYYLDVVNVSNAIILEPNGAELVNSNASGNLQSHGTGLYILTILGNGTSRCFGPIGPPSFT